MSGVESATAAAAQLAERHGLRAWVEGQPQNGLGAATGGPGRKGSGSRGSGTVVAEAPGGGRCKGGKPHYGSSWGKDAPALTAGAWTTGVVVDFIPHDRGWVRTGDNQNDIFFDHRALPAELREGPADDLLVSCQIRYRADGGRFTKLVVPLDA